jgi:ribosome-binding protein aMBF1 (putative translation factor)
VEAALFMVGYDLSRADENEPARRAIMFQADATWVINTPHAVGTRKQLPKVTDANFPAALREARLAAGLSYGELARRAGVHQVMPSRYENAKHSNAALPSLATWERLNEVLFPSEPMV